MCNEGRAMMKHNFHKLVEWLLPRPPAILERAGFTPGVYHYLRESGGGTYTRFHLRAERSGAGLLLANATAAARLHPSGVIIAKGILEGEPAPRIKARLEKVFSGLTPAQADADIAAVGRIINTLDTPGDNYPILNLDDPSFSPKAELLDRPLSADVPLAEPERLLPILDRLWELGIPHATIVAGAEPNPVWLVRAVERAQDLGMIAGVRGRASDLGPPSLVEDLAQAGVDHVNVLYLSANPAIHDALAGPGDHAQAEAVIGRIHAREVCPVVEVALVEPTLAVIEDTLEAVERLGVHNAGFYAVASVESADGPLRAALMSQAARLVEEAAADADVRFLWYAPRRYTPGMTLAQQVQLGPRCSGDLAIRVEPDGSVLAARGPARSVGNLLHESWETIQTHPVYRQYRQRLLSDTHCDDCPGLAVCGADCPRDPAGWAEVKLP
jgi:radical SAM protein with 4Fe4S-binding SPASM domain